MASKRRISAEGQNSPAASVSDLRAVPRRPQSRLDLHSYLIMPIQRIPRYRMLLRALIKYSTLCPDQERAVVERAQQKISSIAQDVNDQKKQLEMYTRMKEIDVWMVGTKGSLIHPLRKLLEEESEVKLKSGKKAHIFIFSDKFMWTLHTGKVLGSINLRVRFVVAVIVRETETE